MSRASSTAHLLDSVVIALTSKQLTTPWGVVLAVRSHRCRYAHTDRSLSTTHVARIVSWGWRQLQCLGDRHISNTTILL